ncbi:MAG TPA: DUF4339 domain-containing protein [Dongiaceae bacterium]|jgi:hypothetical protein|nr:DUF4339 domain-containing protein [Dongiaceae bacterium]
MDYYVNIAGQTKGPYTIHQLRQMWNAGTVTRQTLYSQEGMSEWLPLGHLQYHLETEPETAAPVASGTPQTPAAPAKRKSFGLGRIVGLGCLGIFILILLLIFIGALAGNSGKTASDNKFDAYYTAKTSFVPAQLKAPSTAKFADFSDCTVTVEGDVYTVSGWVDAQNSFGAMIRQNFVCKLRLDASRGKWVQIDTSIF